MSPSLHVREPTGTRARAVRVSSGTGWLCDKGGEARRIKAGDVIWAQPGTTHWHGADDGSIMTHFVVGLGDTNWLEKVTDEDYKKRSEL